jgi:hypothetical protein
MNFNGVLPEVIYAVNNLQPDEVDPQRRYVELDSSPLNEREALFVVGFLYGILSQENKSSGEQDNQQPTTTTGLILECNGDHAVYSDEAVAVFCGFLKNTTTLSALHLAGFPPAQFRLLLRALHTNTSVKELKVMWRDGVGSRITELLRHKTDFVSLRFQQCCPHFDTAQIVPFLREGPALLQELEIDSCGIGDSGTRLLVDAIVSSTNKYKNLKTLKLSANKITSDGLQCLSKLDADVLPSLERLHLGNNCNLLDDAESTKLFARKLLLSKRTHLEKLHLRYCMGRAAGYSIIIKSMEENETVRLLDVTSSDANFQPIRDQLITSLPRMKGVKELHVARGLLDLENQPMMTAFRQNASVFKVRDSWNTMLSGGDPRLKPIMVRNTLLAKLDSLLGTTTTRCPTTVAGTSPNTATTVCTIPPPSCDGLWPAVLAKVGHGCEGGSPVFKILRNRLVTWVVAAPTTSTTTARKAGTTKKNDRGPDQEACTTPTEKKDKKRKQR